MSWYQIFEIIKEKRQRIHREKVTKSSSRTLEESVLSCSDQQIVTGSAYAISSLFFLGCKVSAYHYNIVATLCLISCATHLSAVAIVTTYWRYPLLAALRVISIIVIYTLTGMIYSNQNTLGSGGIFPSAIPSPAGNDSVPASSMLYPAGCFEGSNATNLIGLQNTLNGTFIDPDGKFDFNQVSHTLQKSGPANYIHGYSAWISLMALFGLAFFCSAIRAFLRVKATKHQLARGHIVWKLFWFLQAASCLASLIIVSWAWQYVSHSREWIDKTGWMEQDADGKNPEMEISSFGQLVPLFLIILTVFQIAQSVSEKFNLWRTKESQNHGD